MNPFFSSSKAPRETSDDFGYDSVYPSKDEIDGSHIISRIVNPKLCIVNPKLLISSSRNGVAGLSLDCDLDFRTDTEESLRKSDDAGESEESDETKAPTDSYSPDSRMGPSSEVYEVSEKSDGGYVSSDLSSSSVRDNYQVCPPLGLTSINVAYRGGAKTEHIHCTVVRDKTNFMYDQYELRLNGCRDCIIIARKSSLGRKSSFHLYDMTSGGCGNRLSKKSLNYIGKLMNINVARAEYVLVNQKSEREELAGFVYDHQLVSNHMEEYRAPRKLFVALPLLDCKGFAHVNFVSEYDRKNSLVNVLRGTSSNSEKSETNHIFWTKDPVLEKGNYRLNFKGRVSVPSVKNFQLIGMGNISNILLQFGKIGEDLFNLDFKGPFNAHQAFAIALTQFQS